MPFRLYLCHDDKCRPRLDCHLCVRERRRGMGGAVLFAAETAAHWAGMLDEGDGTIITNGKTFAHAKWNGISF